MNTNNESSQESEVKRWFPEICEEVTGFAPTREELLPIARYWCRENLNYMWFRFCPGARTQRSLYRAWIFANERIIKIANILGIEPVYDAIREVEEEFKEEIGPDAWGFFQHHLSDTKERLAKMVKSERNPRKHLIERFIKKETSKKAQALLEHIDLFGDTAILDKAIVWMHLCREGEEAEEGEAIGGEEPSKILEKIEIDDIPF